MDQSSSYPRAIVHFDGDSFFASVEQAKDYRLRGKPVVTGGERGSVTSLSKEAKMLGAHRGMPMQEIRRVCPSVIVLAGDYTAYSIYAKRMYAIAKTFTTNVEEYSIDECFADITGLNESRGQTYEEIAEAIKEKLELSLGITFGVGLAPSKTLAKVASKRNKPAGFTALPKERIEEVLKDTEIYDVWGLGGAHSAHLRGLGVVTAFDFIQKPAAWLKEHGFTKPVRDTWLELQGYPSLGLSIGAHAKPQSVMVTRTFTPPSMDREYIFSQLSKNVEAACAKVRRAGLKASALSFYLKTQEFTYHGVQLDLLAAYDAPPEILKAIRKHFNEVYAEGILYRASGVTLRCLRGENAVTPDLFGAYAESQEKVGVFRAQDLVNRRYGRNTIYLGSSMQALVRSEASYRKKVSKGFVSASTDGKKSLDIPYLGTAH
ncbi:MAG: polymerase [Patescibacteria group bacterium]|nr:polymerase [Patescibacteria group bacterium]